MKPPATPDAGAATEAGHGLPLMLLSVLLFAANTLLLRATHTYLPVADAWLAMLYRGAVGLLFVAALYGFGRGLSLRRLVGSRLVVVRGVVGAIGIAAFYLTIQELGASRAVVLNLSYPIFATLIAALWLKETVRLGAALWMLAGFAGLAIFLSGKTLLSGASFSLSFYDGVGLVGAMAAGLVIVIIRKLRATEHAGTIYASQCLYSLLAALPMRGGKVLELPAAGHALLILAALIVGVSQIVMTNAFRTLPVSRGSAIQMLLPLVTAVGAWLCFGEHFTPLELAGGALTLFATWRVTVSPAATPPPMKPPTTPDPAVPVAAPALPKA